MEVSLQHIETTWCQVEHIVNGAGKRRYAVQVRHGKGLTSESSGEQDRVGAKNKLRERK